MSPRVLIMVVALAFPARLAPSSGLRLKWCAALPPAAVQVDRTPWTDPPSVRPLRWLMRRLHAPGSTIEAPCVALEAGGLSRCGRPALASFFSALDATAALGARTGVVVFGNSLIASDGITSVVRERLVARFGDGGRGMVLADRMASYGPRGRTAQRATGWETANIGGLERPGAPVGLAGVIHVSEGPAKSTFALHGERVADVFWFGEDAAPALLWRGDDGPWAPLAPSAPGPQMTRVALPEGTARFELKAPGAGAVAHGVALERDTGGVVLDVFGVPSADANLWLDTDEASFGAQLEARGPELVVVMLGGNEAKRIAWRKATPASTEEHLAGLLERLARSAPGASCLVVGPLDAVVGPSDERDPFRQRPQLARVIALEREVAHEHGCAFFDLYEAMGGKDSLKRLAEAGLMADDLVHPRSRGLDLLGLLISDALLAAYAEGDWVDAPAAPRVAAGAVVAR